MKTTVKITLIRIACVLFCLLVAQPTWADADACRKNKCQNGKRYKHWVCLAGGTSNCGNTGKVGPAWHCIDSYTGQVDMADGRGSTACSCGNVSTAVEGHAHCNANTKYAWVKKHEFGCGWPNKWKGGFSSLYQTFQSALPSKSLLKSSTTSYVSYAHLANSTDNFNYASDEVTLNDLEIVLEKYTPDMANDYSSFVIEILKVTGEDDNGEDITTSLYRASGTIYEESLVIEDATAQFSTTDFADYEVGTGGLGFAYSNAAKVISLSTDITSDDVIIVKFYVDCNDYESGGRPYVSTGLLERLNEDIQASSPVGLQIIQNPVMGDKIEFTAFVAENEFTESKFTLRDISGKIVKEWNIVLSKTTKRYQVNVATLPKGIYLLSFVFRDAEYSRKVILDRE